MDDVLCISVLPPLAVMNALATHGAGHCLPASGMAAEGMRARREHASCLGEACVSRAGRQSEVWLTVVAEATKLEHVISSFYCGNLAQIYNLGLGQQHSNCLACSNCPALLLRDSDKSGCAHAVPAITPKQKTGRTQKRATSYVPLQAACLSKRGCEGSGSTG